MKEATALIDGFALALQPVDPCSYGFWHLNLGFYKEFETTNQNYLPVD